MKKLKISAACSCRKMVACLVSLSLSEAALAGCDIFNPVSGQTVTCSVAAPNPSAMGATAVVGSDNVTVNIDTGTILNLNDQNGVLVYSDSTVFQRGTLNITNDSFDGISARLAGNSLHNVGTITTQGFQSEGIYLSGTTSQAINESGGQISTSGENSSGIISFGSSPATVGNNTLLNAGSISTSGTLSSGIYAQGSGNQLTNTGSITTSGTNASGLQANGSDNSISNSGTVVTQGLGANAINNDGGATLGSVTNSGSLSTSGDFANGVYFGGSADFTNTATGTITSTNARGVLATGGGTLTNNGMISAGRDGIDSPAGAVTIINTGSITSGNERAVHVESNDNSTLINSGDLTGNGVAVQFSGGNDVFIWQNSGTLSGSADMGAGDDSVTLRRLTDVNLAAMPLLQGGAGQDQLTLENSQLSDPSRFIDWESVLLQSASQLSMTRPLVLGDATTQTGTLSIDSTSVLLAGGQSAADIAGFGGANDVTVTNAGTLDLTDSAGSTQDRLTIHGNYVGDNGVLKLQTVLNGDDSASDRLVISGGEASGSTQIQVTNVGGTGVATAGSGIMLVEATNGATTTASAFTLAGGSVSAGAYDYLLFRGSSDDAQSWYLRNSLIVVTPPVTPPETPPVTAPESPFVTPPVTPPDIPPVAPPVVPTSPPVDTAVPLYRQEAPLYQAVAPVAQQIGIHQIATYHDRQGQVNTTGQAAGWARTFGVHSEQSWSGTTSPSFDGHYAGLQVGQDLLAGEQDNAGIFYGFTRAKGDVRGFIRAQPDAWAGNMTLEGNSAGAYWTHHGKGQSYVDLVVIHTWLNGSTTSGRGNDADVGGKLWSASLETGYPIPLTERWSLEPQAQIIGQRLSLDDSNDGISSINYSKDTVYTGRVGARVQGSYGEAERRLQPFLTVNVWHEFDDTTSVTLGNDRLTQDAGSTALEVGVGLAASISRQIELYSSASHTSDDDSNHREDVSGNLGVRIIW